MLFSPSCFHRMASRVLLATLSVPICPPRNDIGDMLDMGNTAVDNERKLAKMLGLQTPPNRAQLANDLVSLAMLITRDYYLTS